MLICCTGSYITMKTNVARLKVDPYCMLQVFILLQQQYRRDEAVAWFWMLVWLVNTSFAKSRDVVLARIMAEMECSGL